jgi:hypothetical protein
LRVTMASNGDEKTSPLINWQSQSRFRELSNAHGK